MNEGIYYFQALTITVRLSEASATTIYPLTQEAVQKGIYIPSNVLLWVAGIILAIIILIVLAGSRRIEYYRTKNAERFYASLTWIFDFFSHRYMVVLDTDFPFFSFSIIQ